MYSGPVSISFRPTAALLELEIKRRPGPSMITFDLELAQRETVKTPEGEDLGQLDWRLTLNRYEALSDRPEHLENVGVMMFLDSDSPSCFIKIAVLEPEFDGLLAALQVGRMPSRISVEVKGLSYGHDPEGRDKVWNTKQDNHAAVNAVTQVAFTLPIGAEYLGSAADGKDALPPTASRIDAAQAEVRHELQGIRRALALGVALLAILLILVAREVMSR